MKKVILKHLPLFMAAALIFGPCIRSETAAVILEQRFSDAELDELFSPIALYPDPLLAQVVPAATFVDQLEDAQRVLNGSSDDNLISQQSWDVAVKSVAHYPQVLQMMVDKVDWTTAVGQAYVNQSTDVGKSIQRLRAEARSAGSLVTTSQQEVIVEGSTIKIVPAQPQVIYVPQYNPQVVYVEQDSGPSTGDVIAASAISFGVGLALGAWLNNDWDWYGRGIYYHGWVGGGWVGVNRSYINVNRNFYINNSFRNVNVNRNITNRNINSYRNTLNRNANVRQQNIARNRNNINRNNINRNNVNRENLNRNNVNRDNLNRNNANRGNVSRDNLNRNNVNRNEALRNRSEGSNKLDSYRGRETRNTTQRRSSGSSVFGGGGNRAQVKQERERGSRSVQKMNSGGGGRKMGGGGRRR